MPIVFNSLAIKFPFNSSLSVHGSQRPNLFEARVFTYEVNNSLVIILSLILIDAISGLIFP